MSLKHAVRKADRLVSKCLSIAFNVFGYLFAGFLIVNILSFVGVAVITITLNVICNLLTGEGISEESGYWLIRIVYLMIAIPLSVTLFVTETPLGKGWWAKRPVREKRMHTWIEYDDWEYPDDWDDLRHEVYSRDSYRCGNCRASNVEFHAHHIVPLSVGGSNNITNLATLCRACHKLIHPHMQ